LLHCSSLFKGSITAAQDFSYISVSTFSREHVLPSEIHAQVISSVLNQLQLKNENQKNVQTKLELIDSTNKKEESELKKDEILNMTNITNHLLDQLQRSQQEQKEIQAKEKKLKQLKALKNSEMLIEEQKQKIKHLQNENTEKKEQNSIVSWLKNLAKKN
jgi:uncharacterized protein YjcR